MADTKLTSFQRQLNLYGFRRITKGDDHGAYFHPNFQRGRKDLVANIRRLPVKATNSASTETPSTDSEATSRWGSFADTRPPNHDFNTHASILTSSPSPISFSYSGIDGSYGDLELMDEFDQPPKKKTSISLTRKEGSSESPYLFPSFLKNENEQPNKTKNIGVDIKSPAPVLFNTQRTLTNDTVPLMSKLSMNIGYARHLAATSSLLLNSEAQHQTPKALNNSSAESASYSSFNLLSKNQSATQSAALSLSPKIDPISSQQAYYEGVREARQQPACLQDYPPQSLQLNSMYSCSKNSSSISDFKLLINQTCSNEFSNGNDGGIWQPRLKTQNSASTSNSSISGSYASFDGIDLESYDYDDIPSFDEAMDMMASRLWRNRKINSSTWGCISNFRETGPRPGGSSAWQSNPCDASEMDFRVIITYPEVTAKSSLNS